MESLLIGAAGGLVVLLVEWMLGRFEKYRETKDQRIIRFKNEDRRISGSIFNHLGPRSSVELMKNDLGPPNRKMKEILGIFTEDLESPKEPEETNSYLYFFKNASVKILSRDGEIIESLVVMANYNEKDVEFGNVFFTSTGEHPKALLNDATVTKELLKEADVEEAYGCRDCFTAVHKSVGPPFHMHATYFCIPSDKEGDVNKNPELLVGSVINGICLSANRETASYIYLSEIFGA